MTGHPPPPGTPPPAAWARDAPCGRRTAADPRGRRRPSCCRSRRPRVRAANRPRSGSCLGPVPQSGRRRCRGSARRPADRRTPPPGPARRRRPTVPAAPPGPPCRGPPSPGSCGPSGSCTPDRRSGSPFAGGKLSGCSCFLWGLYGIVDSGRRVRQVLAARRGPPNGQGAGEVPGRMEIQTTTRPEWIPTHPVSGRPP